MRRQRLTGKFPTKSPTDPDNGSPGTVGTITALTKLSVVLQRLEERGRTVPCQVVLILALPLRT
jgi:hypothetical protein